MTSEAEYLAQQATLAKARLRRSASLLADELLRPLNVRGMVQRRPWWSLGGAALAGFVSGCGLARRRSGAMRAVPAGKGGKVHELMAALRLRLRRVVRSALGAVIVASLRGNAKHSGTPRTNGHVPKTAPAKA